MTNPVAMKSLLPGNLCIKIPTLISRLSEEMTNSGLTKEMYKMNLKHWVILDSKKASLCKEALIGRRWDKLSYKLGNNLK